MFSRSRPCFRPDCTNIDLLFGPPIYEKIYSRVTLEKSHLMKSLLVRLNAAYGEKNTEFGLIKKLRKIKDRF